MARIGTAYIEISGDFSQLRRQLATMNRGQGITVEVKADFDRSSTAGVEAAKERLGRTEEFKVKADVSQASQATALLTKESAGLGDVFNRSNLSIGQWTAIIAAASPVIVDMVGALGALTASAAAATVGLGALALGGAAALTVGFAGVAAIAAPAISSLKDLMTAQQAHNKAATTGAASAARTQASSAQQIKTAQEAVATATRGVTTAEEGLQHAQESETVAQKALTLAREEAERQLQDMRRAAIEGGTSEKRAQLSIEQAEANLRTVRASSTSTALDIRDAELGVTEARQNAKDVSIQAKRAQEDFNKAQKGGIDQMPGVVSAQQSLDSAIQGVQTAQQGVADAHRQVAKALDSLTFAQQQANSATVAGGTSLAALQLAQKKAGPAAVKFAKDLKAMGQRWRELTKAGKADFFGLLNDGLDRLDKKLPLFAKSADRSMDALRGGFDAFLAQATGPGFNKFVNVMTRTFANSMTPIGQAFGNIGTALERIAVAVAPDIVRMVKGFEGMTQGWVDSTRNAGDLRDTVHGLVNQANTWWKLIKATASLIKAALVPGLGQGKQAVEGITATIKEWTRWLNKHPEATRDFMKEGLKTTGQLFDVLAGFIPQIIQISTAMRPIARAMLGVTQALNSLKVGNVTALTALLGAFVAASGIKKVGGAIGAFKGLPGLKTLGRKVAPAAATSVLPSAVGGGELTGAAAALTGSAEALTAAAARLAAASGVPLPGKGALPKGVTQGAKTAKGLILPAGVGAGAALAPEAAAGGGALAGLAAAAPVIAAVAAAAALLSLAFIDLKTNFLGVRDIIVGAFHTLFDPLKAALTDIVKSITGAGSLAEGLKEIWKVAWPVLKVIGKLVGIVVLVGIAVAALPILTFIAGLVLVAKGVALVIKGIKWLIEAIRNVVKVVSGPVSKIAGILIAPWRAWFNVVKDVIGFVIDKVGKVVEFVRGHWGSISHVLLAPFKALAGGVKDAFNAVKGVVQGVIKWITDHMPHIKVGFHSVGVGPLSVDVPEISVTFGPGDSTTKVTGHQSVRSQRRQPRVAGDDHRARGQRGGLVTAHGIVPLMGFQGGGIVGKRGLPPGTRDKIPALLEIGELVIPKKLVDQTKANAKKTATIMGGEIGKGYKKVAKDAGDFVKGHGKQLDKLRTTAATVTGRFRKTTVDDFQKTTKQGIDVTNRMRSSVADGFDRMKSASVETAGKMRQGVVGDFRAMTGGVHDGLQKLAEMTNAALKALGVKKISFAVSTGGGGGGGNAPRHQQGGTVVPGTGSGDTVPLHIDGRLAAWVEPKEIVHVSNRTAAAELLAHNKAVPRRKGGGIVPVPSSIPQYDVNQINSAILPAVEAFVKQWKLQLNDAYGPGHASPEHTIYGTAVDFGPGPSGSWDLVGKAAVAAVRAGYTPVGYDGRDGTEAWSGHGPPPGGTHVHVTFLTAAEYLAGKKPSGAKGTAMVDLIKQVALNGPEGPLKDMGQASLDKVRHAANAYITKHQPAVDSGAGIISGVKGSVVKVFAEVAKRLNAGPVPTLALFEAGLAESGMQDLAGGMGSSQGVLQLLASTAQSLGVSPHDVSGVASIFLLKGFTDGIGAIKRHEQQPGLPAYTIAQLEQGSGAGQASAGADNYGVERTAALALMRQQGLSVKGLKGYSRGGIVPYLGEFHDGGPVLRDGFGLLKRGEEVLPHMKQGGTLHRLQEDARETRQRERRVERRLEKERAREHPDKDVVHHLKELEKRLQTHEARIAELITEQKQLHIDTKEHNRLYKEIRLPEKAALRLLSGMISEQQGRGREQLRRSAAAGSATRI